MRRWGVLLPALLLASTAVQAGPAQEAESGPMDCPASVGPDTRCSVTKDAHGAWVVTAMPANWNRRLIVHAHGGPRTGTPQAADSLEDLDRFSVMVRQGYAWTGSTYRRGGYGVRMAAEDTETSRALFWRQFGRPERTILHGQSWGGNVAAKASELYALDVEGRPVYDGVILTNGVLSGGTQAYGFRADLRAVYQFYCRNHPGPADAPYPVWQGLPLNSDLTRPGLRERIAACTGIDRPVPERTQRQAASLRDILNVTGIQEDQLVSHLTWATFLFQDLVQRRLGGFNPFDNSGTVYTGSSDDEALNAGVERFSADPDAVARLAFDADLSGLIVVPTITLHALHDPVVSFSAEDDFRRTVRAAGRGHLLLQIATDEREHSKLDDGGYLAVLAGLETWIQTGDRPTAEDIGALCERFEAIPDGCRQVSAPAD